MVLEKTNRLTDQEIINQLRQTGNTELFGKLYDRYAQKVYRKCLSILKNENDAQDIAQDILTKTFLKIGSFKGDSSFSTWLYHITYNTCIDFLKKQQAERKRQEKLQLLDTNPDYEIENTEQREALEVKIDHLENVFSRLDPNEQSLLLMKYQDGLKIEEISNLLQVSNGAVKMRLMRTRDKLRKLYDQKPVAK